MNFIPCVVGSKAWNKKKHKEPLSDIATCSDESFVLLTLENNYARWMSEALWLAENEDSEPGQRGPKNFPSSKYTNSGASQKNGRSKRLQGWAREGYLRFNALYQLVALDRLRRANFELELLAHLRNRNGADADSDSEVQPEEEEIFPANDLEGLVDPSCGVAISSRVLGRYKDDDEQDDDDDPYNHSQE
jgi:hypothetical protein